MPDAHSYRCPAHTIRKSYSIGRQEFLPAILFALAVRGFYRASRYVPRRQVRAGECRYYNEFVPKTPMKEVRDLMALPQNLLEGIDDLEPLPITINNLVAKLGDDHVSSHEIAHIIEYDEAITATLLRAANSASLGVRIRVERIGDAVARLGINQLLSIALGVHFKRLSAPLQLYDLSQNDLWLHAAVSSLAAKEIMAVRPGIGIPPLASVAALTHDIGKLILVRSVDADVNQVLEIEREKGITFVEAERQLFGFDHAEVGAAVAEKWAFPDDVRHAIEFHHQVPVIDPTPMLDTVVLANAVAKTLGVGLGAEGLNVLADGGCLKRLGLHYNDFDRLCSDVLTKMAGLEDLYAA